MTLCCRSFRPKPLSRPRLPPRCTWNPSTEPPWPSSTIWPLNPISAIWMRAHELGQPLMLTVTGTSSSALMSSSRRSSSGTSAWERTRVSANDNLQYSIPVQAIRFRRQCDGRDGSPSASSPVISSSSLSSGTSRMISFWYGVKLIRSDPARSARSATADRMVPDTRPAIGATPTALSPFFSRCTPTWSIGCLTRFGRRTVDEFAFEVLGFEHLTELLNAPVLDRGTSAGPSPAVAGSRSRGTAT